MISCDNKIVCRTLFFLVDYVLPSYLFPHLQIRYIIEIITPNQREWSRAILPVITSCDQCVSGVTRWGDIKGGWRDHEGDEESVPMLSQVRNTGL